MKIIFDRNILINAVIPALGFTSTKNTIASTGGILLTTVGGNSCEISAYDLEKGIKTCAECAVVEQGSFIINAIKFGQIIRTMPDGPLTIEIDDKTCRTRIFGGKAMFELQAMNGSEFPDLPDLTGDRGFKIGQAEMKDILMKTSFAVAVNDTRPALNGLFIKIENNTITAVGCDSNRLSMCEKIYGLENTGTDELDMSFIIPGKAINELMKFLGEDDGTLTIYLGRKHIIFYVGGYVMFTRLIDAEYLDYKRFIPKSSRIFVSTDSELLVGALERALLVTEDKQQGQTKSPVILNFQGNLLTVSSSSIMGKVNDEIYIEKEGDDIEIGFNCRYILDAIKVCDTGKIKLSLTSPLMSMVIEPAQEKEDRKDLMLVLPVRLNK